MNKQDYSLEAAARWYGEKGFPIFPVHSPLPECSCGRLSCESAGKHPHISGWQLAATSNLDTIQDWWKRWPGSNIGLLTGRASGVVIDVDPRNGGRETLESLISLHGEFPVTAQVATGGGGTHFFFAQPTISPKNGANVLGKGIDIKGDGGYVVAPPSMHRSGQRYQWEAGKGLDEVELASMPPWMNHSRKSPSPSGPAKSVCKLFSNPHGTPEGQRDNTLWRLACWCHRKNIPIELAERHVQKVAASCRPPFDPDIAVEKVRRVYANPTIRTISVTEALAWLR